MDKWKKEEDEEEEKRKEKCGVFDNVMCFRCRYYGRNEVEIWY